MTAVSTRIGDKILLFCCAEVSPFLQMVRSSLAVGAAAALAWLVHQGMAQLLTRLSSNEIERIIAAEKMVADGVGQLTQNRPFSLVFRFIRPEQKVEAPACAGTLQTGSGGFLAYAVWRDPQRVASTGPQPSAAAVQPPPPQQSATSASYLPVGGRLCGEMRFIYANEGLGAPFVAAPTMVASVDILLRDIERFAGNENPDDVANLRLCAGTRTLLGREICDVTEQLRRCLSGEASCVRNEKTGLRGLIEWRRWAALLLGLIQYICLAIFFFVLLSVLGRRSAFVNRDPILVSIDEDGVKPIDPKVQDLDGNEGPNPAFLAAKKRYDEAAIRSNLDQMFVHTFVRESSDVPGTSDIHAFRQFLVERVSSNIGQLEKLTDAILKLAFAGTIVGIAQALFAARDLDTANPIARLSVKAEMFAGIGVAFGTTLFGLGLVLLLDRALLWLKTRWEDDIARSFHLVLDYSKTEQAQRLAAILGRESDTKKVKLSPTPTGFRGLTTVAALIAVGLCAWLISVLSMWGPIWKFVLESIRRAS